MVRVCLYLALALGLAGSANAGTCATNLAVANAATSTTASSGDFLGGCTVTTGSVVAATYTHSSGKTCSIKCAAGFSMSGKFLRSETEALVLCNDANTLVTDFACTACTAQADCTTSTASTCSAAAGSETKQKCTAAAGGFYLVGDVAKTCTSQTGCATEDKTAVCVGTSKYKCTKPLDGYYLTGAATYLVSSTKCDGPDTPNTGQGNYANARDDDKFETLAEYGAKCAKADGTLDTGKSTIANCPPGSFLEKVAGSNDKCTACATGTKSICHCNEKGGATKCLATGICDKEFWEYTGTAGAVGTCKAVTACKAGEFKWPESTSATDNTCTDCPTIENVLKANTECNNLVRSTVKTVAAPWTKLDFRTDASKNTAAEKCKSDTYTCGKNHYLNTATPPACIACKTAANYDERVCDSTGALTSATTYALGYTGATTTLLATACGTPTNAAGTVNTACVAETDFIPATAKGSGCTTAKNSYTCTAVTTAGTREFIRTQGTTTADAAFGSYQALDTAAACNVGEPCTISVTGTNIGKTTNKDTFFIGGKHASAPTCVTPISTAVFPPHASSNPTYARNGIQQTGKGWVISDDGNTVTFTVPAGLLDGANTEKHALCIYQAVGGEAAVAPAGSATGGADLAATFEKVSIITMSTPTTADFKCAQFDWASSQPSCSPDTTVGVNTVGGTARYDTEISFGVKAGYKAACSATCDSANGIFTVTPATACKAMVGCLGDLSSTTGGINNGGTNNKNVACVGSGKDMYKCTTPDYGYFLVDNGKGDTVSSCMSAGQKAFLKDGTTGATCGNTNACWYKGACKAGYSLTKGEAKKSDMCVSDSAASLSLTAVLLSVVAKVFLF